MKQRKDNRLLACLLVGCGMCMSAQAATTETTLPMFHVYAQRLSDTATAGTGIAQDVRTTPLSISVISQDEMDRLGVYRLTDAVAYTAGVTAATKGYDALYDNALKIRGFEIGNTNIRIDGARVFGTTAQSFSPELYGMEQVEVLRGPASTLHGGGTVGGLLNLRTKVPQMRESAELQVQYGAQHAYLLAGDINEPLRNGRGAARVVVMHGKRDLFYDDSSQKRTYVAPSLRYDFGARDTVTWKVSYQDDDIDGNAYWPQRRLAGNNLATVLPDRYFVGVPGWDRYRLTQRSVGYEWTHTFNATLSFHQQGTYRRSDITSYQTTGVLMPNEGGNLELSRFGAMIDSRATAYNWNQYFHWQRSTGDTLLGWDWHREKSTDNQQMRMLSAWPLSRLQEYVAGAVKPEESDAIMPMGAMSYWNRETGLYLHHTETVGPWTLAGGIRYSTYRQYDGRDDDPRATDVSARYEQTATTGELGAVYEFGNGWYSYAHWRRSFDPMVGLLDKERRVLPPMTGQEWEAGLRYAPAHQAMYITAAIYDLRKQHVPRRIDARPAYYESIGEVASNGFELEWRAAVTNRLHLLGSYTYTDHRVTKHTDPARIGNRAAGVPLHAAALRADYVLLERDGESLTAGVGLRYLGARTTERAETKLGGVTVYDASLSYTRNHDSLTLHVRNLFDKVYATNISEQWGQPVGYAGQERSWILSYIHRW